MNNPAPMVRDAKASLRTALRLELKSISPERRAQASREVCDRFRKQELWRRSLAILFYAPRGDELDVFPLLEEALRAGKLVALPQFDAASGIYRACQVLAPERDLISGRFGIAEPGPRCATVPLNQLDLILVPGVAFDGSGRRLGRGLGFYDRLLVHLRGTKCGLGFDEQLKLQIPVESHDVLLDCIVTPGGWLDVRQLRPGDDCVG